MKVNKGGRRRLMGLAYVGRWIESQWHKMSVMKVNEVEWIRMKVNKNKWRRMKVYEDRAPNIFLLFRVVICI